jgi:hypothetical protein
VSELKDTDQDVSKFEEKLHKLIKRAKKQRGMLWPSVVSKLELARADVRAMIKVYKSGPKYLLPGGAAHEGSEVF